MQEKTTIGDIARRYEITWETDEEEAERRKSVDGNGKINDEGNYVRTTNHLDKREAEALVTLAEEDPEASVKTTGFGKTVA